MTRPAAMLVYVFVEGYDLRKSLDKVSITFEQKAKLNLYLYRVLFNLIAICQFKCYIDITVVFAMQSGVCAIVT